MASRYLRCVLICEGNSDRWFLPILLRRAVEHICREQACHDVEVDIASLEADHQRPAEILRALKTAERFELVLYHHDGAPSAGADAKIAEVCSEVSRERNEPIVPVVPIRETEAWLLSDPEALGRALGVKPAGILDAVPTRAKDVEAVHDPKLVLSTAVSRAAGRRANGGKLKDQRPDLFARIADTLDLDRLRTVPSFARWWADMTEALERMGYLNG